MHAPIFSDHSGSLDGSLRSLEHKTWDLDLQGDFILVLDALVELLF